MIVIITHNLFNLYKIELEKICLILITVDKIFMYFLTLVYHFYVNSIYLFKYMSFIENVKIILILKC